MAKFVNPFKLTGNWYRANLHTHTNKSDGGLSPKDTIANYKRAGYDVIALTDHNYLHTMKGLTRKDILVISGAEIHPFVSTIEGRLNHIVCLNVHESFRFKKVRTKNPALAQIRQIQKAGGLCIQAHPFWTGLDYHDFKDLVDVSAVEVWNTICDEGAGRGCSENEWAYALDNGWRLPAVAVDDSHSGGRDGATDAFGGWTWLKMKAPTVANVLKAIRTGACYATNGPKIHDFRIEGGHAKIRCSAAQHITIKAGPGCGYRKRAKAGKSVTSYSIPVPQGWLYIRAVVTDAAGRCAWSNPIWQK